MENYPSYSYPDSGDSSPRSREIDFENPPPSWEDQPQQTTTALPPNFKVKFMVSYGGKIQPRSHDNLLSYTGGDTKILAVDRSIKFTTLLSKLASLISPENDAGLSNAPSSFTFKYQLPGEDLDALISVTNDDDLEHLMHEYDRMYRGSTKPARLRLFLFPNQPGSGFSSTSSELGLDRGLDRFTEHPVQTPISPPPPPVVVPPPSVVQPIPIQTNHVANNNNNVDFLFGLDNKVPIPLPVQTMGVGPVPPVQPVGEPEMIHEMNRMQISAQENQQHVYRPPSEENFAGGDVFQKHQPIPMTGSIPTNIPTTGNLPAGYWQAIEQQQQQRQQHHVSHQQQQHPHLQQQHQPPPQQQFHQQLHQQIPQQQQAQQPVYMMHAPPPGSMYQTPVVRPVTGPPNQGYYQVQRMPSDGYREQQQMYSMPMSAAGAGGGNVNPAAVGPGRQVSGESAGYAQQVGYDGVTGRQVYYAAAPAGGGVVSAPYQGQGGVATGGSQVSGEMRGSADGKVVVQKVGGVPNSAGNV